MEGGGMMREEEEADDEVEQPPSDSIARHNRGMPPMSFNSRLAAGE